MAELRAFLETKQFRFTYFVRYVIGSFRIVCSVRYTYTYRYIDIKKKIPRSLAEFELCMNCLFRHSNSAGKCIEFYECQFSHACRRSYTYRLLFEWDVGHIIRMIDSCSICELLTVNDMFHIYCWKNSSICQQLNSIRSRRSLNRAKKKNNNSRNLHFSPHEINFHAYVCCPLNEWIAEWPQVIVQHILLKLVAILRDDSRSIYF